MEAKIARRSAQATQPSTPMRGNEPTSLRQELMAELIRKKGLIIKAVGEQVYADRAAEIKPLVQERMLLHREDALTAGLRLAEMADRGYWSSNQDERKILSLLFLVVSGLEVYRGPWH